MSHTRIAGPLRVLEVVHRFLPELGGTETHVAEVTTRLERRADIDVTVLTTDRSGKLPIDDRVNNVRVLRAPAYPREHDYYFSPALTRRIAVGGWDVVHFQGVHTLVPVLGMRAARRAGLPYLLTFHSGGNSSAVRSAARSTQFRLLTPLLRGAARLIAVSRFERGRFSAITGIAPERFEVVGNGGALPAPSAGVRRIPGRIVSSGRLEKYKGHHLAIKALPVVQQSIPGAELVILGAGPYEAELRALAARLGVSDSVTIRHIPPGDRAAMADELGRTSVMAALSSYEAHPVGVLEAAAQGLRVVGLDAAGLSDLVEDGLVRGIAPNTSIPGIAAALLDELAAEPIAAPPPMPTWEGCADRLAEIYHDVAAARVKSRM